MKILTKDEVLDMPSIHERKDVSYILVPNTVDVIVSDDLLPREINPTTFAFVFTEDGKLVMANNRRRGPEVAGGHIEGDETSMEGAKREALEETGAHVDELTPVGFFRSVTEGEEPENYRYPYPVSCQQFFAGIATRIDKYEANDECLEPFTLEPTGAKAVLKEAEFLLYKVALRDYFPQLADELEGKATFVPPTFVEFGNSVNPKYESQFIESLRDLHQKCEADEFDVLDMIATIEIATQYLSQEAVDFLIASSEGFESAPVLRIAPSQSASVEVRAATLFVFGLEHGNLNNVESVGQAMSVLTDHWAEEQSVTFRP
ncbi:NUDIX domain-containing protein [Mesorhizobium sp. SP-1A]|uniref:NUDIX domain-containing protein n=1 Tax=Mesorhizobium sp. SP-1A TaxID=3077840 RepID=UPI0028F6E2A4|nr:NUDIX domain-containing protein [Mesorhizobium sp. SP-1A]